MNSNAILSSDVLDIIFDNRNKNYGAYNLRKFYPDRVKTSLFIMLGMAVVFSAFTLLPDKKKGIVNPWDNGGMIVKSYELPKEKEQPKQKQQVVTKTSQQKLLSSMRMVDEIDSADVLHDITDMQIGSTTFITTPQDGIVGIQSGLPTVSDVPASPALPEVGNTIPVDNPDVPPAFPGGNKKLIEFLQNNLHSPEEIGETVQVQIKFVVGYDGNLQTFDVTKDGGAAFNNEVIRVLKKMPQWVPGKKGGHNVPAYFYLPVKFTPED